MARIIGVNIPDEKRIDIGLTYIYGIGPTLAKKILESSNISADKKVKDLTKEEINTIKEFIEKNYKVEGDLRRDIMVNIKRLKDINSWRGSRHTKKLPVRGQTTRINSRTVRGNVRKTVGSGRKGAPAPK
ncbi:MAG TPA: 30S ribosomal protein S13 [Candidatus Pacearchaeota archaeon]|jgi:small subunit ribosomal protein S13|nr:30S ribosomal protein S13 [Parcubacteria group bacterium]HOF44903.1 30S ribosomal protein S13 [Candidatus Pacearchaeota archaeon]HOS12925.1 30S ribosomal protein S13 [Candidatus Pacearchaeota archaeon]HPL72742.1 30S ribosomal protein S13 [Candidatus Pacearchaeota archaeon]HPM38898.1 30S ribosomal protein S13 [Candidatus Pacearchaeota archaeon]